MILTQELLYDETVRRVREARPDLADAFDLSDAEGLSAASREAKNGDPDDHTVAVCVLRAFDLGSWIQATCDFALGIAPGAAEAWLGDFTRTVFLAGTPDNLRARFRFAHVAEDGSAAWAGPGPDREATTLRRLLKLFDATAPVPTSPPTTVQIGSGPSSEERRPARFRLHMATAGVTVADALVHLNHLLSEAVLKGVLHPGDRLTLCQVPRLTSLPGPPAALRVAASRTHPDCLSAYAALTDKDCERV